MLSTGCPLSTGWQTIMYRPTLCLQTSPRFCTCAQTRLAGDEESARMCRASSSATSVTRRPNRVLVYRAAESLRNACYVYTSCFVWFALETSLSARGAISLAAEQCIIKCFELATIRLSYNVGDYFRRFSVFPRILAFVSIRNTTIDPLAVRWYIMCLIRLESF